MLVHYSERDLIFDKKWNQQMNLESSRSIGYLFKNILLEATLNQSSKICCSRCTVLRILIVQMKNCGKPDIKV